MKKIAIKILEVLLLACFVCSYSACLRPASHDQPEESGDFDSETEAVLRDAFASSLHITLKENCAQCHGSFQKPYFAQKDSNVSFDIVMDRGLVDLANPSSSHILLKLARGHNNFPLETISSIEEQIKAWASKLGDVKPPAGDGGNAVEFEVANASSILFKIKNIVHGGALTDQEWKDNFEHVQDKEKLKSLVGQWMETEEGDAKLKFYLEMALNQDVTSVQELFGDNFNIYGQLSESTTRTALDLIKRDRPFFEIATTNRFMVNTKILAAYAHQDRREGDGVNLHGLFLREGIDSDETDWRFVTFVQNDAESPPPTDLALWRSIPNEGTVNFGVPRVGFFSTLAFQTKYPTNDDNQFRVTINQTLIAGLGRTFTPSDSTHQPNLIHMDSAHSPEGTQCFGCHRLMDPMRNVFRGKMDIGYRFNTRYQDEISSFAFYNHNSELSSLTDLGNAIGSHPNFHTAWTQKMCVALNTKKCLETDPEFLRVAKAFKDSGFKFKVLYKEIVTSPLVTGSEKIQTNLIDGFSVARTRATHFCINANARKKQIQAAIGVSVDTEARLDLCIKIRDQVGSLGDDYTIRGLTHAVNSYPLDTFFRQAVEQACFSLADRIRRRGDDILGVRESGVQQNLDVITQYFMGIPASHPRYTAVREAVEEVYNYSRTDLELDLQHSMAQVVTFACTSPDFTGVGL